MASFESYHCFHIAGLFLLAPRSDVRIISMRETAAGLHFLCCVRELADGAGWLSVSYRTEIEEHVLCPT